MKIESEYSVGDIVLYKPKKIREEIVPVSLGFITQVKDKDLIKVFWYIKKVLPHARRGQEWIPAAILEQAGNLRVLSRKKTGLTKLD